MNPEGLISQYLLFLTVFRLLLRRYFRLIYETVYTILLPDDPEFSHEFPFIQREAAELYPGT